MKMKNFQSTDRLGRSIETADADVMLVLLVPYMLELNKSFEYI